MVAPHRLGKLPAQPARPQLKASRFLDTSQLPPPPESVDWLEPVPSWPMYGNADWGDCVLAEIGHHEQQISLLGQGTEVRVTLDDVLGGYSQVTGFDLNAGPPGDNPTDQGTYMQDAMAWWRKTGIAGHQILAYASIDPAEFTLVRQCINLFGAVSIGFNFPRSAMDQFNRGQPWDVVAGSPLDGGHCVMVGAYSPTYLDSITWAARQPMTYAFWRKYCVAPETRILTADLRWIPASDLTAGDRLLAFDEDARVASAEGYKRRGRLYRGAHVESARTITQPCYDLEFDDGTKVRCSADHQWLVGGHQGARWMTTERLSIRRGQASRVVKPLDVWSTNDSRDGGYLAAAFDGEGCLVQRDLGGDPKGMTGTGLNFAQRDNAMLAETERAMKAAGFECGHSLGSVSHDVHRLTLGGGRAEVLRFLGSIRPHRLLDRLRLDKLGLINHRTVRLVSKTFVGDQPVVALTTDAKTYFAEGLASHNCDEVWVVIDDEMVSKLSKLSRGVDLATFAADFESLTGEDVPVPAPPPVPQLRPATPPDRALREAQGGWAHTDGRIYRKQRRAFVAWENTVDWG